VETEKAIEDENRSRTARDTAENYPGHGDPAGDGKAERN
jgi:hypothetical protein